MASKSREIEGHQRRRAAGGADGVVGLLEPADGARHQHQIGAFGGEAPRHRGADAARRAGDERDAAGEALGRRRSSGCAQG